VLQIYRIIRHRGSVAASPSQPIAIPFHAAGIALCLENKGT